MKLRPGDMFGPASATTGDGAEGGAVDRELVVWVDEEGGSVALMRVGQDRFPRLAPLSDVMVVVARADIVLEDSSRIRPRWLDREIDEAERAVIDQRMDAIRPLVEDVPHIFIPSERGRLIGDRHRELGVSRNSLKAWLHAFFRFGLCANALMSHYDRCGRRKGPAAETWAKIGRPVTGDRGRGCEDVTAALMLEFENAVARERKAAGDAFRISGAYGRWHDENCYDVSHETGRTRVTLKAKYANIDPASYEQFRRWYHADEKAEETARIILSDPIFDKDNRAKSSTSTNETRGPGSRLQIDASEVNFALSSTLNRRVLVGRPNIYFVRDVWSRYICGYYLGFQPPSMIAASLALMSAFTKKDAVLKKFGFDPAIDVWEWAHVGAALLHDGGELRGHQGDFLAAELSMTFEQTTSDRGDLKGAVETLFHWSDVRWSSVVPGRRPDPKYRGRNRKPDDIELAKAGKLSTVFEFEREVVLFILRWNSHVLSGYDADKDMVAAGIPRIPLDMLRWGLSNRGRPRAFPDDVVRFMLMPRAKVKVYPEGISFQEVAFTCPALEPLQAKAAKTGRAVDAVISHDFKGDAVYWHDPSAPGGFRRCARTDAHRWIDGLTFEEVAAIGDDRARIERARIDEELRIRAEDSAARRIESDRRDATPLPPLPDQTRAEARKAKTQARSQERTAELKEKFSGIVPEGGDQAPAPTGVVVPFRPPVTAPRFIVRSVEDVEDDDE